MVHKEWAVHTCETNTGIPLHTSLHTRHCAALTGETEITNALIKDKTKTQYSYPALSFKLYKESVSVGNAYGQ